MQKTNAAPGDLVEVHLTKVIYEGVLLESPSDEKGIILLKLDSGYNIGLSKKDVLEIKLIRKFEKKEEKFELQKNKEKPNVAMILTGGTIVNRYDSKTGAVSPLTNPEQLFKFYPEIFGKVNVIKIEVPFMKASEDMNFKDWQKIAKVAEKLLNDPEIKGVIITHGTDTLHYTSAALSFFLRNLNKPVVLTYSQRSSDRASSDANLNLNSAALAAISDIAEVMLVGHATTNDDSCYAMPGTKVRKMHSSRRDAFKVINGKPFAKISGETIERISNYNIRNKGKVKADIKFEEKVALIKFYPGQDPKILDYYLKEKYSGIIIEGTGLGHVPALTSKHSWLPSIKRLLAKGIMVGITTQTVYGRVNPYVYSNLRALSSLGVIFLEDMIAETALIKMGWVLGHTKNKEEVKKMMLTNYAHEISERLEE